MRNIASVKRKVTGVQKGEGNSQELNVGRQVLRPFFSSYIKSEQRSRMGLGWKSKGRKDIFTEEGKKHLTKGRNRGKEFPNHHRGVKTRSNLGEGRNRGAKSGRRPKESIGIFQEGRKKSPPHNLEGLEGEMLRTRAVPLPLTGGTQKKMPRP